MKNPSTPEVTIPYGAFELKRAYQKNLGMAILIAGLSFLGITGLVHLYFALTAEEEVVATRVVRIRTLSELGAPPSISKTQVPQLAVAQPQIAAAPKVGIPKAVPDDEAPEEVTIATQAELGQLSDLKAGILGEGGGGDSIAIEIPEEEYLPPPDEFVPFDELPAPINPGRPPYPELARKAGIEGTVWVKALVDKRGKVRDALVVKESGAKAGFEEASLQHAYTITYKPAISNGQPIAVWVTYPVHFKLGN
ncbi:MAG: TonB family protein [Candidatus Zixiibacteriota bacterium]